MRPKMQSRFLDVSQFRPSLPSAMLVVLFSTLWIAGGSSVADAAGQMIVRGVAATLIAVAVLFCERPTFAIGKAPFWLLAACAGLVAVQLVPLPPSIWQALPGREPIAQAAPMQQFGQIWRPLSLVPSLTLNALLSLLVPAATLLLLLLLSARERRRLPGLILFFMAATMLVSLLQFSGSRNDNPFIKESYSVSGMFANRNHFALFMVCGCLVAPAWAAIPRRVSVWREVAAAGLVALFLLVTLASGSRGGFALALLSLPIGAFLVRDRIRGLLQRKPRWAVWAGAAVVLLLLALAVAVAIGAGRGESLYRTQSLDVGADLRVRTLPAVIELIRIYFPFGSGFGSFDPVFRMHEPFDLLKLTYFNHAHDDFLEVAINGGIFGIALVAAAIIWWGRTSVRAWRARQEGRFLMPKLGSAILFVVLLGAVIDYAARTPMMMAIIVTAAFWLNLASIENADVGEEYSRRSYRRHRN